MLNVYLSYKHNFAVIKKKQIGSKQLMKKGIMYM